MPWQWQPPPAAQPGLRHLRLWPLQSLPPRGFAWFIGATAVLISFPLLAVLATPVFWGLLPFVTAALAGIWYALRRSHADRRITEDLRITEDSIHLLRQGPHRRTAEWRANPYWVEARLYPTGGPVPDYLTLRGGGREVEIGAFLTPEERQDLLLALRRELARLK